MSVAGLAEGDMAACVVAGEDILICRVEGQFYAEKSLVRFPVTLEGGKVNITLTG